MVFFELYTPKARVKHKGGETSRIFYTNSSGMIVVIVCITNGSSIDTLPGCSQFVCCLLQLTTND